MADADAIAIAQMRLLINDPSGDTEIYTDDELTSFLGIEGGNLKRAAAQAIDTIADNQALVFKVITDHQLTINGAQVAQALRARATTLRAQAEADLATNDDDGGSFFAFIPGGR